MLDLVQALETGLDRLDKNEWDTGKLHVSDLAVALEGDDKKCPKALWLRIRGAEKKELKPGQKLMFQQGNNLHEMAVKLLREGLSDEWLIDDEVSLDLVLPDGITGRTDCLLRNKKTHKVVIIDFKTLRGNAFNYLDSPKASNVLQVQTYMMATDADKGYLLYIDREGQNFARQFEVKRDDKAVLKAIDKAKTIATHEVPPPVLRPSIKTRENKNSTAIYIKEPWQCSYCDFRDISCPGALPKELREAGVVGHVRDNSFNVKKKYKKYNDIIEPLVKEELLNE